MCLNSSGVRLVLSPLPEIVCLFCDQRCLLKLGSLQWQGFVGQFNPRVAVPHLTWIQDQNFHPYSFPQIFSTYSARSVENSFCVQPVCFVPRTLSRILVSFVFKFVGFWVNRLDFGRPLPLSSYALVVQSTCLMLQFRRPDTTHITLALRLNGKKTKKSKKNMTSETMKRIIPNRDPFWTATGWASSKVASPMMSLHQVNTTCNDAMKPVKKDSSLQQNAACVTRHMQPFRRYGEHNIAGRLETFATKMEWDTTWHQWCNDMNGSTTSHHIMPCNCTVSCHITPIEHKMLNVCRRSITLTLFFIWERHYWRMCAHFLSLLAYLGWQQNQ